MSINNLRGISDYIAEKISDDIGHDRLIPLDKVGEYAFVDIEGCAIYLITIAPARLVLAASQPEASSEAGTVTRPGGFRAADDMSAPNHEVIDATHGEEGDTYTLDASCFNCGWKGTTRRLKGVRTADGWKCPNCGCYEVKTHRKVWS